MNFNCWHTRENLIIRVCLKVFYCEIKTEIGQIKFLDFFKGEGQYC